MNGSLFGGRGRALMLVSVVAAVVAAAVAGSLIAAGGGIRTSSTPSEAAAARLGIQGSSPLAFGREVSLEDAEKLAPFPISLPSTDLANDSSILHVWVQGAKDQEGEFEVAVRYGSGITVTLITAAPGTEDTYKLIADQLGAPSIRVTSIGGRTALVIPPNADGAGNPGSAAFVIEGVEIVVYGAFDPDTLEQVAASVPTPP